MEASGDNDVRLVVDPRCALLLPMPFSAAEVAGNAGIHVLARDGMPGLTLQGVAAELRMTPQGVRRWFGSAAGMRKAIAQQLGHRWPHWLLNDHRNPDPGVPDRPGTAWLLPLGDHEIAPTRAWLAIGQAASDDPELAAVLAPCLALEEAAVRSRAEREGLAFSPDHLDLLLAAARGLRQDVCRLEDAMPVLTAQRHLRGLLDVLTPQ